MRGRLKRLIKRALLGIYPRTEFLLKPIRNEFEANLRRCFVSSFDEVRISLDSLVAEVYRLQAQVEELREETARLRLESNPIER